MVAASSGQMQKAGIKSLGYIGFSDAWGDLVYGALQDDLADRHQDPHRRALCRPIRR
jgi:hypothetical protein